MKILYKVYKIFFSAAILFGYNYMVAQVLLSSSVKEYNYVQNKDWLDVSTKDVFVHTQNANSITEYKIIQKGGHDSSNIKQHIAKNTIYIELLGNGFLYSLNYDRLFLIKNQKFSFHVGLGYLPPREINRVVIPIEFNFLKDTKRHYEAGIGVTYAYGYTSSYNKKEVREYSNAIYLFIKPVAFRIQDEKGGVFFKVSSLIFYKALEMNKNFDSPENLDYIILNILSANEPYDFGLTLGISVGYTFKK